MEVFSHLWTWHLSSFHLVSWVFILLLILSTFMSHVTPLSLSNNASSIITLWSSIHLLESMMPSLRSCHPMFKGKLCWEFASVAKNNFLLVTFESVLWLLHTQITELCSKFCVVDVGFIMSLLRRDYSCQLQLIIRELVLEKN